MSRRKSYPANLLEALGTNDLLGTKMDYEKLTPDQMKGVDYILSQLTQRERIVLDCYYKEGMSRKGIAEYYHLTEKRVRQIIMGALEQIRAKEWLSYAANGYENNRKRMEEQLKTEEALFCAVRGVTDPTHIYYQGMERLNLPVRPYNSMKREGIRTVRDVLLFLCSGRRIRNFGARSEDTVIAALARENLLPEGFKRTAMPPIPKLALEAGIFRVLNACDRQDERRGCD